MGAEREKACVILANKQQFVWIGEMRRDTIKDNPFREVDTPTVCLNVTLFTGSEGCTDQAASHTHTP